MTNEQLQKVAEQVLDVETRIFNWRGNVTEWGRDLIRLRATLQLLVDDASNRNDATREKFLKGLQYKTDQCWENVLSRSRWMMAGHDPDTFKDRNQTQSGDIAQIVPNYGNA